MNHQRDLNLSIRKVSSVAPKIQLIVIKFITVVRTDNHYRFIKKMLFL